MHFYLLAYILNGYRAKYESPLVFVFLSTYLLASLCSRP
jgi:hypothetical protein